MRYALPVAVIVSAVTLLGAAEPAGPDLARLVAWRCGVFDNFQQLFEAREARMPPPHSRMHLVVSPVVVPALGDRVLLEEASDPETPGALATVRLLAFSTPDPDGAVLERVFEVDAPPRPADEGRQADWRAAVAAAPRRPLEGCEVAWRERAGVFEGATAPGRCRVSRPGAGTRAADFTCTLTATSLSVDERAAGQAASAPPRALLRARLFTCFAVLRKESTTDQYDTALGLTVHDQGHMVPILLPPGAPARYAFELSQLRYGGKTPVMKLALYETGKETAFSYVWSDPAAVRLGINLRWLQVGCSPKGP